MLKFLRKRISDLEKTIVDKKLLKQQKEEELNIQIPFTNFNQRYYASKIEPIIANKLKNDFDMILSNIRQQQNIKMITNQSSIPLEDGIDLNDIISKVYCDFEHKYQLIQGQNVDIVWNLNVLNKNFFDSLNNTNNLEIELKKRLQIYIQQMIRWGFPISNVNLTVDLDFDYIQSLYKTFEILYQKKIIKKGFEKGYWSLEEQKFITPENYNITYRNIDLKFVSYEISNFGNNEILQNMFKKDKLYAIVMVNELQQIPLGNAIKINTEQQYLIINFYGHYYLAEKNFLKSKINQKYQSYKVLEEINGSQLIGCTIKNHFNDNYLEFIEQDNIKLQGTKLNLCCPNFNHEDFILSKENNLNLNDNIDQQGFILNGELQGYKYFETSEIIQEKLSEYIEDYQMQVNEIREIKKKVSEEKLILMNKDYFYIYVNKQQKDQIFQSLEDIKFKGQTKDQNDEILDLENYLERNQFKISEETSIGIPVPIIRYNKKRQKIQYKNISNQLLEKLKQIPITQWSSINLNNLDSNQDFNTNIDSQKFSLEFLQAFNIIYNLQKKNLNNKYLQETEIQPEDIDTNLQLPYIFTAFNVLQNENYLPLCLILSQIIKKEIPFDYIKRHGVFIDQQEYKLQQSVEIITNGVLQDIGHQHYAYGIDAFRLYLASIDVDQDIYTNIKIMDHYIQNKKAEINLIRQVYKQTFQLINKDFQQDLNLLKQSQRNLKQNEQLELLDQIILNQFQIMKQICNSSYKNKNYNIIYETFLDFFINYFSNIYIQGIKTDILCKRECSNIQKQILAYILEETLKIIAPILPFNSENIYQEIQWKEKKQCIFEELQTNLDIKPNLLLLEEAQQLQNFNIRIKDLIVLLKQKEYIKSNKELDLYLGFAYDQDKLSYHKKLNILQEYIESFPFQQIFDVSGVHVIETTDEIEDLEVLDKEQKDKIKIYVQNEMIPIQAMFKVIPSDQQCQRCDYYLTEKNENICIGCQQEMNLLTNSPKIINNQQQNCIQI